MGIVETLFPTPLYISKIDRELTKNELNFIKKNLKNTFVNKGGNKTSKNTYILNDNIMKNIKKNLLEKVKDYFDKIIMTTDNVVPYITQSWLNFNDYGESHHLHSHTNSLISGVFYINCLEDVDSIIFTKYNKDVIGFSNFKKNNLFNTDTCEFKPKQKTVLIFPSSLLHKVNKNENNHTRITLSFNVFVNGVIGDEKKLNLLTI